MPSRRAPREACDHYPKTITSKLKDAGLEVHTQNARDYTHRAKQKCAEGERLQKIADRFGRARRMQGKGAVDEIGRMFERLARARSAR